MVTVATSSHAIVLAAVIAVVIPPRTFASTADDEATSSAHQESVPVDVSIELRLVKK